MDGSRKANQVVHLMLQMGLLQMSSMAMSTGRLGVHEDQLVEDEVANWSGVMLK